MELLSTGVIVMMIVVGSITVLIGLICVLYYCCVLRYKTYRGLVSLKGKTVVITGASSGIGKATALDLARRGAKVILACRNEKKTSEVIKEIREAVENADVVDYHLDLASLKSVRSFAEKIKQDVAKLDLLINNAGIGEQGKTEDGFDLMFGVNHFGPFLLTNLLLDLLIRSAPSRIINLSSLAHRFSPEFDFTEEAKDGVRYPHLASYPISKMAVNVFTHELSRRLTNTQVSVCSVHPGIVYTGGIDKVLTRGGCCRKLFMPFFRSIMRSPEAGAQCVIYCAIDESVRELSGSYFVDCQLGKESIKASDEELAKQLWDVSCTATGLV
ncbi:retinol dehydrogenase 13-like [Asterias rubens]|uniref:retinol dehydrogenase 13-like n=1 Tax=Asterias rubens TaxID=7604 RepID=UPI001455C50C|nr:retinol dehydrogenase 13-like [Asterias rubens]